MKKIIYLAFSTFLFMCVNNCADYKPIFSSENINFEIGSYSIKGNEILSESFSFSSIYKAQDQYSETIKLENKTTENLINKTYQDLLIKLSANLL